VFSLVEDNINRPIHKALLKMGYGATEKTLIEHVLSLYKHPNKVYFITTTEQMDSTKYNLAAELERICPHPLGTIISMSPHNNGPIWGVKHILPLLDKSVPVIFSDLNYFAQFDFNEFEELCLHQQSVSLTSHSFVPLIAYEKNLDIAEVNDEVGYIISVKENMTSEDPEQDYLLIGGYSFYSGEYLENAINDLVRIKTVDGKEDHYFTFAQLINMMSRESRFFNVDRYFPMKSEDNYIMFNSQCLMRTPTPEEIIKQKTEDYWTRGIKRFNKTQVC
jgi:hypothetical protein